MIPLPLEPGTFYRATAICRTESCPNLGETMVCERMYSNDGIHFTITCGLCSVDGDIVSAVKLDPQPPME